MNVDWKALREVLEESSRRRAALDQAFGVALGVAEDFRQRSEKAEGEALRTALKAVAVAHLRLAAQYAREMGIDLSGVEIP
jgi:hypothetical protein